MRRHRRPPHGSRRRARRHRGRNPECRGACAPPRQPLLRGAISACRPEDDGFPAFLERQLADPFVKGFRRVLHVVPDDLSEGATFRANIKRLAGASRPFDLCVRPDQIDKAIALADLAPSVQFVLDHCGVPAIKDRAEHPWREKIAEIAQAPQRRGQDLGRRRLRRARRPGRSTTSALMSSMRSKASAGIGSSGAATGRSAR